MDMDIAHRLAAQGRPLHLIVATLAPPEEEQEGSGFDDLMETLAEPTVTVVDVTQAVRTLRSDVCARFPSGAAPYCAGPRRASIRRGTSTSPRSEGFGRRPSESRPRTPTGASAPERCGASPVSGTCP